MDITYAIAIYASVQREFGQKLVFLADVHAWDANKDICTIKLVSYYPEWAVLTDVAADQALNIVDGSRFI
jgi:hypothetical protein